MRTLTRLSQSVSGESRFSIVLLIVAVTCLPWGIMAQEWLDGDFVLVLLAWLAALSGFMLARTRIPSLLGWSIGTVIGTILTLALVVDLFPPVWLWNRAAELWLFWQDRLLLFWARAAAWGNALTAGEKSYDNVVLLLLLVVIVWGVSWWAGWSLPRRRSPLAALLPMGLVLLVIVAGSARGDGRWAFLLLLICAFLLLTRTSLTVLERRWDRQAKDYSGELYPDILIQALGIVLVLVLLAASVALPIENPISQAIWLHLYEPASLAQGSLGRVFAGAQRMDDSPGRLEHTVGGTVILGDQLVLTISTDEPHPLPRNLAVVLEDEVSVPSHYWRDAVYDRYTGRGWETSLSLTYLVQPGEPLTSAPVAGDSLVQIVMRHQPGLELMVAANQPVRVNHFVRALGDPPDSPGGDLLSAELPSASTYMVTSTLTAARATVAQLRAAPATYPVWVQERYGTVPNVPGRVRALAHDLTAGAGTPYDKAAVIQEYLRTLTYDTETPLPPPGRDVADYFLFDRQRGYCDHFATAMVVLCRAAGVPARYVTGYAAGEYDHANYRYVVLQKYAHSWVEVYFPGYGWVEFEPTPALAVPIRPLGGEQGAPTARQLLEQWQPREYQEGPSTTVWLLLGALLLALALAVGVMAYYFVRRPAVSAEQVTVSEAYAQLARRAARFGAGPRPWQTPREYLATLGQRLAGGLDRAPGLLRRRAPDPGDTLPDLATRYEEEQYGARPTNAREQARAWSIWERWRNWLWVVVLGREP
ncbi:MAG: transglutaminase domain-containing protein [Chloroflexi bacterium]|nr:transglutaminase domain-containing protein [Chloroflexota bacterium]MBU1747236.1 transglutaminase domain-containing protein [Chloroflexota bacterium]